MKKITIRFLLIALAPVNICNAQLTVPCGTQSIYWSDDFEGAISNWSATNGVWQTGIPTSGPNNAHSGMKCSATNLTGNYPSNASSRLINNIPVTIPPAVQNPRLRFWHWYSYETTAGTDYGRVQIKTSLTTTWTNLTTYSYIASGSGVWSLEEINLSAYSDSTVQFGFLMQDIVAGGYYQSSGWYIDDVEIITGPYINFNPESFENGWNDWSAEGTWEIGVPTVGPSSGCNGNQCAGTNLNGNYAANCTGHLKSPWIRLPPLNQNPAISFCYWFSFATTAGGDFGKLQFRTLTSGWKDTATYSGSSSVWSNAFISMAPYADSVVQFGFLIQDIVAGGYYQSSGWYIDDVYITGLSDTSCFYPNGTVGIDNKSTDFAEINIYPNPSSDFAHIQFYSFVKSGKIIIYNSVAEKVFEEFIFNKKEKEIDIQSFSQGVYLVKVSDGEKQYVQKLIVH